MAGRAPIKGSCGGLSCIGKLECEACPHRHGEENAHD
ncbi:MAG: (Na+)-NQR maturation NqrM [Devosia marina]